MILQSRVVRFGSGLASEVGNAKQSWSDRQGLIFVVEDSKSEKRVGKADGPMRGFGEASPLPGYSPDTIEECELCLKDIELFDASMLTLETIVNFVIQMPPLPAARFAVETALLDLLAQRKGQGIAGLFGHYATSARRCALLDLDAPVESARAAVERGITCAKLKVGGEWSEEVSIIRQLRTDFPSLKLRLDANASWTLPEAKMRLALLEGLGIQFVEQPVAPGIMHKLVGSRVPIAADESLHTEAGCKVLGPMIRSGGVRVLVLKPTVLGGIAVCLKIQQWARRHKTTSVASHCFEGPVGSAAVAELALAMESSMAAGLDNHSVLAAVSDVPVPQLRGRFIQPNHNGLGVVLDV